MAKKIFLILAIIMLATLTASAQYRLLYESFTVGSDGDTSRTLVTVSGDQLCITSADPEEPNPIPGIAKHITYIDFAHDTAYYQLYYSEKEQYFTGVSLHSGNDYQFEKVEIVNGYRCKKYTTSLFSNRMEIWMTEDFKYRATPTTTFADLPGVLVQYTRNGNTTTRLASEKIESSVRNKKETGPLVPANLGTYMKNRQLGNLEKEKLVITIPVFKDAQICFNPKLEKPRTIPYDTTLSFSNGTIILKRLTI